MSAVPVSTAKETFMNRPAETESLEILFASEGAVTINVFVNLLFFHSRPSLNILNENSFKTNDSAHISEGL